MSLDALRQLRDEAWFTDEALSIDLGPYVLRLAGRVLCLQGNHVRIIADHDLCHRAAHWRWLSLLLPADLLIAALAAELRISEPPADEVSLSTPQLHEVLRRPVAETHLHASAGASFGLVWTGLTQSLATDGFQSKALGAGGPAPFGSALQFHARLLQAVLTRTTLASYLWARDKGTTEGFDTFVAGELRAITSHLGWSRGSEDGWRTWVTSASALEDPDAPANRESIATMRQLYRSLLGPMPTRDPATVDELIARDPMADWLPPGPGLALPEVRFAARALRYLASTRDTLFARWFWQYQRVRSITHRHLVQESGTAGLDWFRRHFSRISALTGAIKPVRFAAALALESAELNLDSFEARIAPSAHWSEIRDDVRRLAKAARDHIPGPGQKSPEVGLVLHFVKEREQKGGQRLNADPRQASHQCRYGSWSKDRNDEARAIAAALRHNPELLLVLRGIDTANVELAVPTWPFVPIFKAVREAGKEASATLRRRWPNAEVTPLRATVHAGEDFRRLVEGLRRIHELMEFGLITTGDRIGHGIALGESPKRWARGAHEVTQPAEDRLDDLLWELDRYRHANLELDPRRLELVRARSLDLGRLIYGDDVSTADELIEARKLRHDAAWLARCGYPDMRGPAPSDRVDRLVYRYLTDPGVFERGQRPERVKVDDAEIAMLRAAGRWLRGEAARQEITVETNPSSNLLIGDFVDVSAHPAFRLQPLRGQEPRGGPPVLLSVNDDDPITFATRLADEIAHLYFALLRSGVSAHDALDWLDRARELGHRSRFTLAASRATRRERGPDWLDLVIEPQRGR